MLNIIVELSLIGIMFYSLSELWDMLSDMIKIWEGIRNAK